MTNTHIGAPPVIAPIHPAVAVPILLGWIALTVLVNVLVPQLEKVGEAHSVALSAQDAPSMQAMQHIGKDFQEFDSDSSAMVVLEGDKPSAPTRTVSTTADRQAVADKQARRAHPRLLGRPADRGGLTEHRRQGRLRAAVPAGDQGEALANESVAAVRASSTVTPPPGIKAYVTGPGAAGRRPVAVGDKA